MVLGNECFEINQTCRVRSSRQPFLHNLFKQVRFLKKKLIRTDGHTVNGQVYVCKLCKDATKKWLRILQHVAKNADGLIQAAAGLWYHYQAANRQNAPSLDPILEETNPSTTRYIKFFITFPSNLRVKSPSTQSKVHNTTEVSLLARGGGFGFCSIQQKIHL